MAYVIPIQGAAHGRGPCVVLLVLTKDNLARMRKGDPFDMQLAAYSSQLDLDRPLRDLDLIVAYEEDEGQFTRIAKEGGLPAILAHVERGRIHQPGDAQPPVSVKPKKQQPQ